MIEIRPTQTSTDGLDAVAALLRRRFPRAAHLSAAYLAWTYRENPEGPALAFDARLASIAGALGVGIGFGLQTIVANFTAGRVINWTLSDQTRRVDVPVGVAYGTDPSRVMTILRDVVTTHPRVLQDPPPVVLFMKYGESSLDFEVRFWSRFDGWLEARSEVLVAISEAFATHGIEIPFPQRDQHIRSGPPAAPASSPPASP